MKNKYFAFAKNSGISLFASLIAGAGAAEICGFITNNETAIGVSSTLSEYIAMYSVFLPLHARDNQDIYRDEFGFKWKEFLKDQVKLAGGFFILDLAYLIGKPFLAREFLLNGFEPAKSSIYSDAIIYLAAIPLIFPIGKFTRNIRSKSLEKIVKT